MNIDTGLAWSIFIIVMLIAAAIEFPIFGFVLVVCILLLYISYKVSSDKDKKLLEIKKVQEKYDEKARKDKENIVEKLLDKFPDEVQTIIEKDFQVVASAYRNSVTKNDFGKKNYHKFIPQLKEYIRDNSKLLYKLEGELDQNVKYDIYPIIKFIETKIKESDSKFDYSDDMDPYDYEHLCAEEFKKNKWDAEATQGSSDQGVDVIAKKDARTLVAQCKRFMKPVGNKAVQEIVAGMKYYEATEGVVIAPNGFTNSAKNLAEANNIKLIHHSEINSL